MAIPSDHVVTLVTHPRIDHPLIGPLGSAIRAEGMAEHVPTAEFFPFCAEKYLLEMMTCLIVSQRNRILAVLAALLHVGAKAKRIPPARMNGQPILQSLL